MVFDPTDTARLNWSYPPNSRDLPLFLAPPTAGFLGGFNWSMQHTTPLRRKECCRWREDGAFTTPPANEPSFGNVGVKERRFIRSLVCLTDTTRRSNASSLSRVGYVRPNGADRHLH